MRRPESPKGGSLREKMSTVPICTFRVRPPSPRSRLAVRSPASTLPPVMALVTYVLISAVTAGKAGTFDPAMLGQTASKAFGLLLLEFVCIKLGCYLMGIGEEGTMVDLLAYEGYKFVG